VGYNFVVDIMGLSLFI